MARNKHDMESILNRLDKLNLKGNRITTTTRGRHSENHEPHEVTNDEGDDQSPTYRSLNLFKPKVDIILWKMGKW